MAGFADLVRDIGVGLADRLTASLQVSIKHYPWTGVDDYGGPVYGSYKIRKGIVEYHQRLRRTVGGQENMQHGVIYFPRPIAANGAEGRSEPIDARDKFEFPDGTVFPVLDVEGVLDPKTGYPYMFTVIFGAKATL